MKTALLVGVFGASLTYAIGTFCLGMRVHTIVLLLITTNCAGLISLVLTLYLPKLVPSWGVWFKGPIRTWLHLVVWYCAFYFALPHLSSACPSSAQLGLLFLPLVFSTGFSVVAFGPLQDALVAYLSREPRPRAHRMRKKSLFPTP